ncbi:cell surface A33 antigen [Nothobranchius furzeri]|uniref:Cell surface A33 antigen-like n=1 Tax=Nothobranchius furzeri TaxID=105023 RepID=A0A8C6KK63_NOTFU|nr:cell surface A33 antigen-like [Nothobranchius furzeri]
MEKRTFAVVVFCVAWSCVATITVNIPNSLYKVARGDNITIPCSFITTVQPKQAVITWSLGLNAVITYYYPVDETDVTQGYDGRASLDLNFAAGKADLLLKAVTVKDNGKYGCRVQIPRDAQGQPDDTADLIVLVAPSKPICQIQGKAEYGQNINLTCVSEEGSPAPTYKWAGYDAQNNPRAPDPKTTDKGGILSLYNISKDTSGYYLCTSTNEIRSASCNLTLSVMPPSMNIGSTAAIIGGVVAVLVVLVIIIYCCCCRKKNEKEEYAMGVPEDENGIEAVKNGEVHCEVGQENSERRENHEERSERSYDNRKDYDDRRSDCNDRRSDYNDRRSDYNDRRSDYDDRRSDYDDRRSDYDDRRSEYSDRRSDYNDRRRDYDDRRSDYDDRRSDYDDRRNKYGDRRERYDDDRRYEDERRYNDRKDPRSDDKRDKP